MNAAFVFLKETTSAPSSVPLSRDKRQLYASLPTSFKKRADFISYLHGNAICAT